MKAAMKARLEAIQNKGRHLYLAGGTAMALAATGPANAAIDAGAGASVGNHKMGMFKHYILIIEINGLTPFSIFIETHILLPFVGGTA